MVAGCKMPNSALRKRSSINKVSLEGIYPLGPLDVTAAAAS